MTPFACVHLAAALLLPGRPENAFPDGTNLVFRDPVSGRATRLFRDIDGHLYLSGARWSLRRVYLERL